VPGLASRFEEVLVKTATRWAARASHAYAQDRARDWMVAASKPSPVSYSEAPRVRRAIGSAMQRGSVEQGVVPD
jgi:hypothetical protein